MIDKLAQLHEEYGLYNGFRVKDVSWVPKIVTRLAENEDTRYLADYYLEYLSAYRKRLSRANQNAILNSNLTGVSRTVDFPYLGRKTIELGKARYFFVFEGSLANIHEPSITVLSCLWATNNETFKSKMMAEYWPSRGKNSFEFIVKCLRMNSSAVENCYVTDAVKFGNEDRKPDSKRNRELLRREIETLGAEFVILLGERAKLTYGKDDKQIPWKVIHLPFPTKNYKSIQAIKVIEKKFEVLEEVWRT